MVTSYKDFHPLSFQLGMTAAFCEMVQQGVKRLALSPPLPQSDLPRIQTALEEIAGHYGVSFWLDEAFLPSDLAHEDDLKGKTVALLYREEPILSSYQDLKARRRQLLEQGLSPRQADRAITPALRDLLGYPKEISPTG